MDTLSKQDWNRFILENGGSFLQSYEWGEFQESVGKTELSSGRRVFRFATDKWQAQFIENKLPGVNKFYWHCPRGPVIANSESLGTDYLEAIIKKVKQAAGENVIFFRLGPEREMANIEGQIANSEITSLPASPDSPRLSSGEAGASRGGQPSPSKGEGDFLSNLGFRQLPYDIEPSQTSILDITKTENELLAQMHEKTRYNIRLAERKGVRVKLLTSDINNFDKYFEEFYRLVSEGTAERKQIKHHPKEYYKKQLEINSENIKFILFIAEFEEKTIAANIVVIFGDKATYLHGATDNNARSLMAPHLLQWEQIKYAKSLGYAKYDFWGIVNEHTLDKRGKSWEGFTRFKRGFGGKEVNYVGYWDYSLDKPWYFLYRLAQKFRR